MMILLDGVAHSADAHFRVQVDGHTILISDQRGFTVEFDLATGLDIQNGRQRETVLIDSLASVDQADATAGPCHLSGNKY